MAHTLAGVTLPLQLTENQDAGLPWLTTMVDTLASEFRRYCGVAWSQLCSVETDVVKATFTRDPKRGDFAIKDLPALYLWAETARPMMPADGIRVMQFDLQLLWVPPPVQQDKKLAWAQFWAALNAVIELNVGVNYYSADTTESAYGERLADKLKLYQLELGPATTVDIGISGAESAQVTGHLWQFAAQARLEPDPDFSAPFGPACTQITYAVRPESGVTNNDVPVLESHLPENQ